MKIYYVPDFAHQVEQASKRHQNMVKMIADFFETHDLNLILNHQRLKLHKIREPDLYSIRLEELRILASLKSDNSEQFWIFSQLERHG